MAAPVARAEIWDHDNDTFVAEVRLDDEDGWTHAPLQLTGNAEHNLPGNGRITVRRNHPNILALTSGQNVLRLYVDDEPVFTFDLPAITDAVLRRQASDKVVTITGPGIWERFKGSVVDPWIAPTSGVTGRPISFSRVWNCFSPPFDYSGWDDVHAQYWEDSVGWSELPEAWPVPPEDCTWIWSQPEDDVMPVGQCPFRRSRYFSNPATVVTYQAGNSTFDLWFDGVLLEREPNKQPDKDGYERPWKYVVAVDPGWHHWGVLGTNWGGSESDNPAGIATAVYTVDTGRMILDDKLFVSQEDDGWKCLDYPSTLPGFTAPEILQMLLDEAQARGELEGWTLDAVGEFPQIEEFACRVGDTYYQVIESLSATWVDVACDPEGLVLRVWPKTLGQGEVKEDVEFTEGVNLRDLTVETDGDYWTAVQGLWKDGVEWRTVESDLPRRSHSMQLGAVGNRRAVRKILDEWLEGNSEPVTSLTAEVIPTEGATAGVDFWVGDTVTLAGDPARTLAVMLQANRGRWQTSPQFNTLQAVRRREKDRSVERMTEQFQAAATAAIVDWGTQIQSGKVEVSAFVWPWTGDIAEELDYDDTDPGRLRQPFRMDRTGRVYEVSIEIDPSNLPDATGDTTFELMKNLTVVSGVPELTIDEANARAVFRIYGTVVGTPKDIWNVRLKGDGGGSVVVGNHVDGNITMKYCDSV